MPITIGLIIIITSLVSYSQPQRNTTNWNNIIDNELDTLDINYPMPNSFFNENVAVALHDSFKINNPVNLLKVQSMQLLNHKRIGYSMVFNCEEYWTNLSEEITEKNIPKLKQLVLYPLIRNRESQTQLYEWAAPTIKAVWNDKSDTTQALDLFALYKTNEYLKQFDLENEKKREEELIISFQEYDWFNRYDDDGKLYAFWYRRICEFQKEGHGFSLEDARYWTNVAYKYMYENSSQKAKKIFEKFQTLWLENKITNVPDYFLNRGNYIYHIENAIYSNNVDKIETMIQLCNLELNIFSEQLSYDILSDAMPWYLGKIKPEMFTFLFANGVELSPQAAECYIKKCIREDNLEILQFLTEVCNEFKSVFLFKNADYFYSDDFYQLISQKKEQEVIANMQRALDSGGFDALSKTDDNPWLLTLKNYCIPVEVMMLNLFKRKEIHFSTIELFLKNGANPNAIDNKGISAIMWASFNGDTNLVRLLKKYGTNIEASGIIKKDTIQDITYDDPLNIAVIKGDFEMVKFYVEECKYLDKVLIDTPIKYAKRMKRDTIEEYLRSNNN